MVLVMVKKTLRCRLITRMEWTESDVRCIDRQTCCLCYDIITPLKRFPNYLQGRQLVCVNNVTSDKKSYIGVPQGSILAPFLFLLFVNDLPQYVRNQICKISADDIIIHYLGSNVEEL